MTGDLAAGPVDDLVEKVLMSTARAGLHGHLVEVRELGYTEEAGSEAMWVFARGRLNNRTAIGDRL